MTGANAGATGTCAPADCKSGADGKVAFTYTGAKDGSDTITANATVGTVKLTATAAKTWTKARRGASRVDHRDQVDVRPAERDGLPFALRDHAGVEKRTVLDTDGHTATPDRYTFGDLPAGTYNLVELVPAGSEFHRAECSDHEHTTIHEATATATIALAPVANVTCTFYDTPTHH